jgi:predicted 3-demethylubiquinone-9 3-methyltransferase (glyoxalase superfamily)
MNNKQMKKHTPYPCVWFNHNAKEAVEFYQRVFKQFSILDENPMVIVFEANGLKIMALNGGPQYQPTPAISFVLECETQEEIDYYWEKLGSEGRYDQCGWLSDKFGVSWQVVPTILPKLMTDPARRDRVIAAFMKMSKFNIEQLLNA